MGSLGMTSINRLKDFVVNDALTYLGGISLTAGFLVLIYFLFSIASQHIFNKNIEKYKGEINSELETLRFAYQKTFKDYELYTVKKHEKYPEMFHLLEIAYGALMQLKTNTYYTFDNVNIEDIKKYFQEELKLTQFDQDRLLIIWSTDKEEAKLEIYAIEKRIKYNKAKNKWYDANDYYISNNLYLSDDVVQVIHNHLENMFDYLHGLDPLYVYQGTELREVNEKNDELRNIVLPLSKGNIREKMKSELSQSNL